MTPKDTNACVYGWDSEGWDESKLGQNSPPQLERSCSCQHLQKQTLFHATLQRNGALTGGKTHFLLSSLMLIQSQHLWWSWTVVSHKINVWDGREPWHDHWTLTDVDVWTFLCLIHNHQFKDGQKHTRSQCSNWSRTVLSAELLLPPHCFQLSRNSNVWVQMPKLLLHLCFYLWKERFGVVFFFLCTSIFIRVIMTRVICRLKLSFWRQTQIKITWKYQFILTLNCWVS